MKFKDNQLIWEAYTGPQPSSKFGLPPKSPEEEEGAVMLELEPMGGVEVEDGMEMDSDEDFDDIIDDDKEDIDEVLYSDIKKLADYSDKILKSCKDVELETWMLAKLIKASEYVSDVWHRLDAKADFANDGLEQSDNIDL